MKKLGVKPVGEVFVWILNQEVEPPMAMRRGVFEKNYLEPALQVGA
jgi:hypothetical protein